MKCTLPLHGANKELDSVCLRWSTTSKEDDSDVGGEKPNNRMELNMGALFRVEYFSAISGVVHVVRGKFDIPLLSRPNCGRIIVSTWTDSTEMNF